MDNGKIKLIIKKPIWKFCDYLCRFAFYFKKSPQRTTKYYFSICCIFKDEALNFREWLEYYKIIGVDHIYAYNNDSKDNYREILQPYIDEGFVSLEDYPGKFAQIPAYSKCFSEHRNETFWLAFIDLDEFIVPKEKNSIKDWIKPFEKYPSVIIYWLMFGTNGIINPDYSKLTIEQYTCSFKDLRNVGKICLNTYFTPVKMYHHYIKCWVPFWGFHFKVMSVNESGQFIYDFDGHKVPFRNSIQMNHYWSKSLSEYVAKINKGDMFSDKNDLIRKKMSFFYWHENQNIRDDKTIFRFLIQLKAALNNINIEFE